MIDAILFRTSTSDQGTFGILVFRDQYLYTGELPWRDNKPNFSCIPAGVYPMRVSDSPKFGRCYQVHGVTSRSHILFHHGNFCGDRVRGYRTNVAGCILLGLRRGNINAQRVVLNSREARGRFERALGFEDFTLEIKICY